jgi:hypothetical protein
MKHRIAVAIVATLALSAGIAPSWAGSTELPPARPAATMQGPFISPVPASGSQTPPDVAKPPIMGGPVRPPGNLPLPEGTGEQPPRR